MLICTQYANVVYINNNSIYYIADNEGMKSPIDDANDLLYDKLLYQPPHVELRPPPPIIVRPLSDIDIYNAGGFQLLDLIITVLKSHMTCYNSMPLIC